MDRYLFIYVDIALRVLGGGWRQAGVLAAAGLYALDHMVDRWGRSGAGHRIMLAVFRMELDHAHAAMIADTINTCGGGRVLVRRVDTNLVIAWVDPALASPDQVVAALAEGEVTTVSTIYIIHYLLLSR